MTSTLVKQFGALAAVLGMLCRCLAHEDNVSPVDVPSHAPAPLQEPPTFIGTEGTKLYQRQPRMEMAVLPDEDLDEPSGDAARASKMGTAAVGAITEQLKLQGSTAQCEPAPGAAPPEAPTAARLAGSQSPGGSSEESPQGLPLAGEAAAGRLADSETLGVSTDLSSDGVAAAALQAGELRSWRPAGSEPPSHVSSRGTLHGSPSAALQADAQNEGSSPSGLVSATWQLLPASICGVVAMVVLDGVCLVTLKGSLSAVIL